MIDLDALYESLGDARVQAATLTRRTLSEDKSAAGQLVWHLSLNMRYLAREFGVPPIPTSRLAPLDETAKEWVDRVVELVERWRERGVQRLHERQETTACPK